MYKLTVQNEKGETMELTHNPRYSVTSISGLTPVPAQISTSTMGISDGEYYNSAKLTKRNIVIQIYPAHPIDENRVNLYRYFKSKYRIRLYFKNEVRSVYIDGYVETCEGDLFAKTQMIQVSVICPNPYFIGVDNSAGIKLQNQIPLFEFPFSAPSGGVSLSEFVKEDAVFVNNGDEPSGMTFVFTFTGNVSGIKIQDKYTGNVFCVNYKFCSYDILKICTVKGAKEITLRRKGEEFNLINYITRDSQWLQTNIGENWFVLSGERNYTLEVTWKELYQGV